MRISELAERRPLEHLATMTKRLDYEKRALHQLDDTDPTIWWGGSGLLQGIISMPLEIRSSVSQSDKAKKLCIVKKTHRASA
jgi:hypothetical protein